MVSRSCFDFEGARGQDGLAQQPAVEAGTPAGCPMAFHPGQVFFAAGAAPLRDAFGTLLAINPGLFELRLGFAPAGNELRDCEGGEPP